MFKKGIILLLLSMSAVLVACTPDSGLGDVVAAAESGAAPVLALGESAELSPAAELALATLQLEETSAPIDAAQAEEMLRFWQVLQNLQDSGTAADAELTAVVAQIRGLLTAEQAAAVEQMDFSAVDMESLRESGLLGAGRGGFGQQGERAEGGGFAPPGGGIPGGGGPGGRGGGPGGGDPSAFATRQAEIAESGAGSLQDRMLIGAAIRLIEEKAGVATPRVNLMEIISEASGLSLEELRDEATEGESLADLLTAAGVEVETVRLTLLEALADSQFADQPEGLESFVDEYLNSPLRQRGGQPDAGE